jgi:hypothetical protein
MILIRLVCHLDEYWVMTVEFSVTAEVGERVVESAQDVDRGR